MEGRYEDLPEETKVYLRDQHPRGAQIIAEMQGDDVTPQQVVEEQKEESEEVPPYEEWTTKDLKGEATARGLSTDGKKEDLVRRLYDHDGETGDQ